MRKTLAMLLSMALVIVSAGSAMSAAPAQVHKLKWGHVSPSSYPYHIAAEKVAKEVLEKTNGAVEITIYPANQLGSQREMTESVQTGVIDIVITSSPILSGYKKRIQVLDLPFLFRDRDHAYAVLDGPLRAEIFEGIDEIVGPLVAIWENGFRNLMNRKNPVAKPEDMAGMKFRVMESKSYIKMMECLGAKATPMSFGEVYTALQQGTVDGADAPLPSIYVEKFFEVAPNVTQSQHAYSCSPIIVSPALEKKIGKENYTILVEAIRANSRWQRDLSTEQDQIYADKLVKDGAKFVSLTPEQKAAFREKCKPVWDEFAPIVGQALIDKIIATGK